MFEAMRLGRRGRGDLFDRIGRFLDAQGLEPSPTNYTLAHAALSDPEGPLGRAVARLTDGGVRLNRREIEELGGSLSDGRAAATPEPAAAANDDACAEEEERARAEAQALVIQTAAQVDGFARMMRSIHAETQGFGRDLAASAAAIDGSARRSGQDLAQLAAAMVARTRDAENRLAQATSEADALRTKLAEARDTANRDSLTGLPNRRAFEEAFQTRDEARGPWSLAVCDVDHFKRLNDSHGHGVGDRVLRAIADALGEACQGHLVARYGGEEFAILIAGLSPMAAGALVDGARGTVASKQFRNRDTDAKIGRVSISAGLTTVPRGEAIMIAFERADRLLYTAKADGRDRVRMG